MTRPTRRFVLPTALVVLVLLVSTGQFAAPFAAKAAFDPDRPAFDPLSTFDISSTPAPVRQPPRLLAGTNSHGLPASAASRNGYCLDVNIDGVTPIPGDLGHAGSLGFRIIATDPIDPSNPVPARDVPIPVGGNYVYGPYVPAPGDPVPAGVSSANTGTGSTADDVYCVVVHAPEGYKNLHIDWHYQVDGAGDNIISLPVIPIVTVTLEKIGDGILGGPAEVCTVGWDSAFLTGSTSNAGGLSGTVPDPLNQVVPADFNTVGGSPNVFIDYVRKVGTEWCAGVGSTTVESGVQVIFSFDAVYNRVNIPKTPPPPRDQDFDDQGAQIQLPVGPGPANDRRVNIKNVIELRHVTSDGYVPPRAESGPIVINSLHTVCVVGTGPGDTLNASDIHFVTLSGSPGVSNLQVFTKTAADTDLVGVLDGTICFRYTSGSPGSHSIFVHILDNGTPRDVFFDSDGDGNGQSSGGAAGPLVTEWSGIDHTVITFGGSPFDAGNNITNTRQEMSIVFNLNDGSFIAGGSIAEWVLGTVSGSLVSGVWLRANIVSECGYFVVPDASKPTALSGVSVGGQFEINAGDGDPFSPAFGDTDGQPDAIEFSTINDLACTATSLVRIEIQAFYPGQLGEPAAPLEFVEFVPTAFHPALKTPRVAWAGQIVSLTYAISSSGSCENQTIDFVRPKGQPGAFLGGAGVVLNGAGQASIGFGQSCSATVRYESEDPGEVDIEVFIRGNSFSKVAFPIFFLTFEDIAIEATPDQFVSTFGDVTANIRGYFVGTNPSGRPEEKKADGRTVPRDRWVLPDDWELLKGPSEFRSNWGSVTMPSAIVTFFMENESVRNSYKAGIKNGASGFFIPDDPSDFSFNVNPHTGVATVLGSLSRPRMMSQPSDDSGSASVDTFGDLNLSYEGCAPNKINGNPQCKPEDIVGRTRYFAVVEYPEAGHRGKFPAVASNVAETQWRWAGYKDVTIVNTDSPQIKYIVAHLRDRDGFCDAANFNNTLGVPVRFEIDAGGAVIIEAADQPSTINSTRRFATATSFDTTDALGRPINITISKPPLFVDSPDECQAWIKVTNSLLIPTNVIVTFPAPPSPVPGDIRITALQCVGQETITVKNFGNNVVNLDGFALKSAGTDVGNAEELDLIGILQPGESKTFLGGPGASSSVGWIDAGSEVFTGSNDFASLVWEDFPLSTMFCDGTLVNPTPPPSFPPDGEGEIVIDVVIPFGAETTTPLVAGWNLVPTGEGTVSLAGALAGFENNVVAVYLWDPVLEEWAHYIPGVPAGANTIDTVGNGQFMWVLVKQPFTLTLPN